MKPTSVTKLRLERILRYLKEIKEIHDYSKNGEKMEYCCSQAIIEVQELLLEKDEEEQFYKQVAGEAIKLRNSHIRLDRLIRGERVIDEPES